MHVCIVFHYRYSVQGFDNNYLVMFVVLLKNWFYTCLVFYRCEQGLDHSGRSLCVFCFTVVTAEFNDLISFHNLHGVSEKLKGFLCFLSTV